MLLLVILAVPAVAFAVSFGLLARFEGSFQSALARDYPEKSAAERANFTIASICADPKGREAIGEEACGLLDLLRLMELGALATGLGGLGWLGLIAVLGRLSRGRPTLIMRFFRPGVQATNVFGAARASPASSPCCRPGGSSPTFWRRSRSR
jgi:hypothetical protein